jgi:hypothetical protein
MKTGGRPDSFTSDLGVKWQCMRFRHYGEYTPRTLCAAASQCRKMPGKAVVPGIQRGDHLRRSQQREPPRGSEALQQCQRGAFPRGET